MLFRNVELVHWAGQPVQIKQQDKDRGNFAMIKATFKESGRQLRVLMGHTSALMDGWRLEKRNDYLSASSCFVIRGFEPSVVSSRIMQQENWKKTGRNSGMTGNAENGEKIGEVIRKAPPVEGNNGAAAIQKRNQEMNDELKTRLGTLETKVQELLNDKQMLECKLTEAYDRCKELEQERTGRRRAQVEALPASRVQSERETQGHKASTAAVRNAAEGEVSAEESVSPVRKRRTGYRRAESRRGGSRSSNGLTLKDVGFALPEISRSNTRAARQLKISKSEISLEQKENVEKERRGREDSERAKQNRKEEFRRVNRSAMRQFERKRNEATTSSVERPPLILKAAQTVSKGSVPTNSKKEIPAQTNNLRVSYNRNN